MGNCMSGKRDINDTHPNVFVVQNIDDQQNKVSEGHLEITDWYLLLHQRGKDAVKWPLKSLRRYGAEGDIFSFESGRKCETGPGIYAFQCHRADRLLALLQEKVRSSSTLDTSRQADDDPLAGHLGQPLSQSELHGSRGRDNLPPPPPGPSPAVRQTLSSSSALGSAGEAGTVPTYANLNCNGAPISLQASDGYLIPNKPAKPVLTNSLCQEDQNAGREYENVPTSISSAGMSAYGVPILPPKPGQVSGKVLMPKEGIIFQEDLTDVVTPAAVSAAHTSAMTMTPAGSAVSTTAAPTTNAAIVTTTTTTTINATCWGRQIGKDSPEINYISVDFESVAPPQSPGIRGDSTTCITSPPQSASKPHKFGAFHSGQVAQTSPELRGEYCTIDINRTKALSNTAKQQSLRGAYTEQQPGSGNGREAGARVRKTRHNSSLSELTTVGLPFGVGLKRNSIISALTEH